MPDRVDQTVDLAELIRRPGPGSHRTVLDIDGQTTATLADLPPDRGGLLFVGLNPSPVSVEAGHYHQGRLGRMFWARLVKASILPPGTSPEAADDTLVAAGHGITDLLKRPSARDTASDAELRAGVGPLWQKVALWRPAAVVFVYKRATVLPDAWPLRQHGRCRCGLEFPAEPGCCDQGLAPRAQVVLIAEQLAPRLELPIALRCAT